MDNPLKIIWYNVRNLMFICMLIFSVVLSFKFGVTFLIQAIIGFSIAVIIDFAIAYILCKSKEFPVSGAISGLIVANLFSQGSYIVVAAVSALAILSKQFIRYNKKHVFNPANFGIAVIGIASLFFTINTSVTWLPGFVPGLLLILGFIILYRLRRWEIHLTYFITLAILLLFQGLSNELSNDRLIEFVYKGITEGGILFFVFFMVVEPVTSPITKRGRVVYSFLITVIAFNLSFTRFLEYAPIFALFIVDLFVPLIDRFMKINKFTKKNNIERGD